MTKRLQYGLASSDRQRADEAISEWHQRHGTTDPDDLPDPRLTLRDRVDLYRLNRTAKRMEITL